jgi:hypothetical protein
MRCCQGPIASPKHEAAAEVVLCLAIDDSKNRLKEL